MQQLFRLASPLFYQNSNTVQKRKIHTTTWFWISSNIQAGCTVVAGVRVVVVPVVVVCSVSSQTLLQRTPLQWNFCLIEIFPSLHRYEPFARLTFASMKLLLLGARFEILFDNEISIMAAICNILYIRAPIPPSITHRWTPLFVGDDDVAGRLYKRRRPGLRSRSHSQSVSSWNHAKVQHAAGTVPWCTCTEKLSLQFSFHHSSKSKAKIIVFSLEPASFYLNLGSALTVNASARSLTAKVRCRCGQ